MTRKTILAFVLVAAFILALAGIANATYGDSSYLNWGSVSAYNASVDASSTSPHGRYTPNSKKCVVCHAAHNSGVAGNGVGSEALLLSSRADACTYCHITSNTSSLKVYGGVQANYQGTDWNNAHNYTAGQSVQCSFCHQVHAAKDLMTPNAYLTQKILYKQTAASYSSNAGTPTVIDSPDVAVSKWCTLCHTEYYNPTSGTPDWQSHPLVAADNQHAFQGSTTCVACHASNTIASVVPSASAFPHYTDGARFLVSATASSGAGSTPATDTKMDGICIRCHRNGSAPTSGVGNTF